MEASVLSVSTGPYTTAHEHLPIMAITYRCDVPSLAACSQAWVTAMLTSPSSPREGMHPRPICRLHHPHMNKLCVHGVTV